jgi:glutamine amidotransferase
MKHNLIVQSKHSTMGAEALNGDGFGIGWYPNNDYNNHKNHDPDPNDGTENTTGPTPPSTPFLFRSVEPAWHDKNLKELSGFVVSPTVFAHIRAASPAVGHVQQTNCHPFRYQHYLWMHNGVIRGFAKMKRELLFRIDPDLFPCIEGSTDSEAFFYLALTFGLREDPPTAVAKAVGYIQRLAIKHDVENPVQMTVAFTDGKRMWAFRYSSEGNSRTLFYSSDRDMLLKLYPPEQFPQLAAKLDRFERDSRFIVSEPLGDLPGVWNRVPESTCVMVDGPEIVLTPFEPIAAVE